MNFVKVKPLSARGDKPCYPDGKQSNSGVPNIEIEGVINYDYDIQYRTLCGIITLKIHFIKLVSSCYTA